MSPSTDTQSNTPRVLSRMLVVTYQMQASLASLEESCMEMAMLMKWASSWDTACLEVSMAQIRQARLGRSMYRL